jgi:PKD repeat protein
MNVKTTKIQWILPGMVLLVTLLNFSCSPDATGELGEKATAAFTVTPIAGRVNTFLLQSSSQNAFGYQWDKGNGNFVKGKQVDTAYFPLKGTYTVKLRAFGRGGYDSTAQAVSVTEDDILNNPQFKLLTAKSWKLDPTGSNTIIVGTDNNPAEYFGGGPLADCQLDDVYTFSTSFKLTYNAAGATFNAGNIAPNYTCSGDKSFSNVPYTFEPGTTGGAGLATIRLAGAVPAQFIGVTDISSNVYRIISISANAMVLRSGTPGQTVHQFKFVAL